MNFNSLAFPGVPGHRSMALLVPILVCLACVFGPKSSATTMPAVAANGMDLNSEIQATPATGAYWVFFADHGPGKPGLLTDAARLELAKSVSREAWARRSHEGLRTLPDHRDLPVYEPYIKRVTQFAALRHHTRWLNGISVDVSEITVPGGDASGTETVKTTTQVLAEIAALPFVKQIRPVATLRRTSLGPEMDKSGELLSQTIAILPDGTRKAIDPPYKSMSRDLYAFYGPSLGQLTEINAVTVHQAGFSGNRVKMMMIDTGFRTEHLAFEESNLIFQWDYVYEDSVVSNEAVDPDNQHNHGTGVWATAGGYAPGHLIGPAYDATFALAKTEDVAMETQAEEDNYVAALEQADAMGVVLTTASLGYVCFDDEFCYEYEDKDGDTAVITIALDIAAGRGILCVNSQGNSGCDEPGLLNTPSDADSILAIGAVDSLNVIASFSACGPTYDGRIKPEVSARGVRTVWARAAEINSFGIASGTSLSAPLVAGAAALLIEAHPEWSNMDVREALMQTADKAATPDNLYGWGRIDLGAALDYTPLVWPMPFSLELPEEPGFTANLQPTFSWRASVDPNSAFPLSYTLWIYEAADLDNVMSFSAGSDTTLTLPTALNEDTEYLWEVSAEDFSGNRRYSRERHSLLTLSLQNVPDGFDPNRIRPRIVFGANPFRSQLRFQIPDAAAVAGHDGSVDWAVYDPAGRRISGGQVSANSAAAGIVWDGTGTGGEAVSPGVYYLEARVGHLYARGTALYLGR
jgi:Subtilase family